MTIKGDIDQLAADAAIFHQVVHGSDSATVVTSGGVVPSLAKAAKDAAAPYASASSGATAAAASAAAAAVSAQNAAAIVSGGTAQLGGGAGKIPLCDAFSGLPIRSIKFMGSPGSSPLVKDYSVFSGVPGIHNTGLSFFNDSENSLEFYLNANREMIVPNGGFFANGNISPAFDNVHSGGLPAYRFSTLYAGTGTISTSDAREKTDVRAMTMPEIACAKALGNEIGVFQFLASVAEKGDAARQHVGMTVQRAIEIFEAHGLNQMAYACICYDQWEDKFTEHPAIEYRAAHVDENGVEQPEVQAVAAWTEQTQHAGNRYSFRTDQLNAFISRGLVARLEALEAAVL
jgi:hypothetical protein